MRVEETREREGVIEGGESEGYGDGNDIGKRNGYREGDRIMVTCGENTSEGIEATTDGVV